MSADTHSCIRCGSAAQLQASMESGLQRHKRIGCCCTVKASLARHPRHPRIELCAIANSALKVADILNLHPSASYTATWLNLSPAPKFWPVPLLFTSYLEALEVRWWNQTRNSEAMKSYMDWVCALELDTREHIEERYFWQAKNDFGTKYSRSTHYPLLKEPPCSASLAA